MSGLDTIPYHPKQYIIKDYCKKYPTDPGDQNMHEDDVVQARNKKWADSTESTSLIKHLHALKKKLLPPVDHAFACKSSMRTTSKLTYRPR
jgi:hypothetical protein